MSRLQVDDDADDGGNQVIGSVSVGDRVWSVAISCDDRSVDNMFSSSTWTRDDTLRFELENIWKLLGLSRNVL